MTDQTFSAWLENSSEVDPLLSRKQAAQYLGVKEQTLACWLTTKRYALPYIKVGRLVKYRRTDLEQFVSANRIGMASAQ